MHDDEPLERWAARRESRLRPVGERKAVPLIPGEHGAHVQPEAPRLVLEWDGYQWTTIGMVDNLAAARRLLNPQAQVTPEPAAPARNPMVGTGRHRKPRPGE